MSHPTLPPMDADRFEATRERARGILESYAVPELRLAPRFLAQPAHLTTPATVWKYVEGACTRSAASLVMLDLEDSIPRGDEGALRVGRENVVRAFNELDWGTRLRVFRPRGLALDPGLEDLEVVISGAGARIEGIVLPKVESADEVRLVDEVLTEIELRNRIEPGSIRIEVLIESALAVEEAFSIARSSRRPRCSSSRRAASLKPWSQPTGGARMPPRPCNGSTRTAAYGVRSGRAPPYGARSANVPSSALKGCWR